MGKAKFKIYSGEDGQFYFRLIATNGENILGSEGYTSKSSCENGISSVKSNAPEDERYQNKIATDGQYYFNLTARNGEVIGTSETYSLARGCEIGIKSVKKNAPGALVEDMT